MFFRQAKQLLRPLGGRSRKAGMAFLGSAGVLGAGLFYKHADFAAAEDVKELIALSKKEFRPFTVVKTEPLSHDTSLVRLALPSGSHTLGLTVASCLSISADIDGQAVSRPYTPISTHDQKGFVDFVIKSYPPRKDGKPGGMGRHLRSLKTGDTVKMKGPWKKFDYKPNEFDHIGMIAGGTGITPMYQVIKRVLNNPDDTTKISLLYANRKEEDILLKDLLDALAKEFPGRMRVTYTLDKAPRIWLGEVGFVTDQMIERTIFDASAERKKVFVCGPPPMMKSVSGSKGPKGSQGDLGGSLKQAGFAEDDVYKF